MEKFTHYMFLGFSSFCLGRLFSLRSKMSFLPLCKQLVFLNFKLVNSFCKAKKHAIFTQNFIYINQVLELFLSKVDF